MNGISKKIYRQMPIWGQNLAVSAYGVYLYWLRFGPGYKRFVREYQKRENFTLDNWQLMQQEELNRILKIAVNKVPFYRDRWSKEEKESALNGRLDELPLLDKDVVRKDPKAFLIEGKSLKKYHIYHTSGSTGTPIATYWTIDEIRKARALREARSLKFAEVSYKMPRATFSGRIIEFDPQSKGPFYRFNAAEKQVYFSAFHLNKDTAYFYVEALKKHKIQWLTGYAVSYYLLAQYIIEQRLKLPKLKAIVTTSEKVTAKMRQVMEEAFNCSVFEEYSTVETALFSSECRHHYLHLSPDAGIVEILRPDFSVCNPGEAGEVVTTSFVQEHQILIRYRLGDLAMWDRHPCLCGLNMPVIKEVIGRIEDVVVGPDGRKTNRFHGIFTEEPRVKQGQVIQEAINRLTIKIVAMDSFSQKDKENIIAKVHQRLGHSMQVDIELVENISQTVAGKFKAVVSKIDNKT